MDAGIALASMQLGLDALHAERPLAIEPSPALAVLLFGALTEPASPSATAMAQTARTARHLATSGREARRV